MRLLDDLGRIAIPSDIRGTFGWNTGTKLKVVMGDTTVKSIIIREALPCCTLCRTESQGLLMVARGCVCPECVAKIK